jgi:ubiquinone/menaquinone biosynthesis C-methylase UbiE
MSTNYWVTDDCARAFWDQHRALPYQELLDDTVRWLEPKPGERWLDLGCGGGQLTAALWLESKGEIGQIVAMDCAPVNALALEKLTRKLQPVPQPGQIHFECGNFSDGLHQFPNGSFHGVVSGLAVSYAESIDPQTGAYTEEAYHQLMREIGRILKPGGRFVFSVNVPNPRFWKIFWRSLKIAFRVSKPGRVLVNAIRMQKYGSWLRREAAKGRFHFLPLPRILESLEKAGFQQPRSRLTYADQAYLIRVEKPAVSAVAAA